MKKLLEKDLQHSVLEWLRWNKYVAVKFHSSIMVGAGDTARFIKSPQRGVSDILACSPKGRFIAIECKVGKNKPSPDQLAYIESINKIGGVAFVAYSLKDVESQLKQLE